MGRLKGTLWWLGASCVAALIGIFGPWTREGPWTYSGIEYADGKAAVILLAIVAVFAAAGAWTGSPWWLVLGPVLAPALLAYSAIVFVAADADASLWGVWLLALSAASLCGAYLALAVFLWRGGRYRARPRPERSPVAEWTARPRD